jgi:polyhydroxybutyrate depolymerase
MDGDRDVVAGELTVGGQARTFTLLPPPGGRAGVPLVLVLHGNNPGTGGSVMREVTTFDQVARDGGFAVAYPDGDGGCWADGRGVTTADEAGVDDVAFLRAIIGWSAERHGTFCDRAVVAGMSNGAFMAHRMALQASDQVAVMAAVAGGLPESLRDARPAHAVSAMLIHGTADTISPLAGGYSRHLGPDGELRGRTLSLAETAAFWRAVDRCPPGPGEERTTEFSSRTTSAPGVGGTTVAAWTVFGGGHNWPGTAPVPGYADLTTQEFDAAEEICRFAQPLLTSAEGRRL